MKKRISLLVILFIFTSLLTPAKAQAWDGANLPYCSVGGSASDFDWQTPIYNDFPNWKARSDLSVIFYQYVTDKTYTQVSVIVPFNTTTAAKKVHIEKLTAPKGGFVPPETVLLTNFAKVKTYSVNATNLETKFITNPQTNGLYDDDPATHSDATFDHVKGNITCISYTKNITYSNNYEGIKFGETFVTGTETPTSSTECSKIDIICGLKNLFFPQSNLLTTKNQEMKDFWNAKLGVLLFPFDFISSMFSGLVYSDSVCTSGNQAAQCSSSPKIAAGQFYGSNFEINLATPAIASNFVRPLMQLFLVVIVIFGIHRQYRRAIEK